ncbi:MAG: hypothetical protein OEX07_09290 [Gammaproteobacteria bacterium]|nr:hypothetical protein [Gammaproteobacteria bacterium]
MSTTDVNKAILELRTESGSSSYEIWTKYLSLKKEKAMEDAIAKERGTERDELLDKAKAIQEILNDVKPIPRKKN